MCDKINILLDLDQTLISGEPTEQYDFKKNKEKAKKFVFHDMEDMYIIFERPGLQEFLTFLFDNFNVSVWTAASKDYALFIVDKIILQGNSNRKLDYVFFEYHCKISEKLKDQLKGLSLLWDIFKLSNYNSKNTLIIDDNDEVYNPQKKSCIIAPPFEFNDKDSDKDSFLVNLTKELRDFTKAKDVSIIVETVNKKNKLP